MRTITHNHVRIAITVCAGALAMVLCACLTVSPTEHIRNTNDALYTWLGATPREVKQAFGAPTQEDQKIIEFQIHYSEEERSRTVIEKERVRINGKYVTLERERTEYYIATIFCNIFFVFEDGKVTDIKLDGSKDNFLYRIDCYDPDISKKFKTRNTSRLRLLSS